MNAFRDWLNTLFGSDGGRAIQMLFALLLVVLLIFAVTWLFRRLFGGMVQRGRSARLSVVDSTVVDHHRRLLLVRRDDVEHLVMIGGPNDLLVESRILRAAPALAGRPLAAARAPVPPAATAPLQNPAQAPIAAPPLAPHPIGPTAAAPTTTVPAPPRDAAPPPPEFEHPLTVPTPSRVAGGAAAVVAAVASAGALLRARIARSDEPEPVPFRRPTAPEPERRTFDQAFDTPLGRPAPGPRGLLEPQPPLEPPRRPEIAPAERAGEPTNPRPVAAPPTTAAADLGPRTATPPPAPAREEPTAPPAPSRSLEEIDLLADFDQIAAELGAPPLRDPEPTAPIGEPTLPFARPLEQPAPRREPPMSEVAPVATAVEEPNFDFDFDFGLSPVPEPAAAPVEPAAPRREPIPPPVEDFGIEILRHEDIGPETEAEAPATPEKAPEITPPEPRAPTGVDELEEEMARLLSELSGQPRR